MSGEIYLLQDDGNLVEMSEQTYDSEDLLQGLIEKYPNLLPGDQIDQESPRKWLLISREMGIASGEDGSGRWSVDHLFVDQDGIPTLVEVKRSSDTRIRREVVGQLLEYAANATVYWSIGLITEKFTRDCEAKGLVPEEVITEFTDGEEPEPFWEKVEANLKMGKVRLVFLADEIPSELKRIVEFLNKQMSPAEVLAVEVKQYVGNTLKTLVPRVIGQTSEAQQKKHNSQGKQWDLDAFKRDLAENTDDDTVEAAKKIYEWAKPKMDYIWWGKGKVKGSFVPVFIHADKKYQLFAVRSKGHVEIYFNTYQSRQPFDQHQKRRELLDKLNSILPTSIPEEALTKFPKIPLSSLKETDKLEGFLTIYDWFISEVRGTD